MSKNHHHPQQGGEQKHNPGTETSHGQTSQNLGQQARNLGSSVGQQAKDLGSSVGHQAKDLGSSVGQQAKDLGSSVGQQAKDTASSLQEKASSTLSSVRDKGQDLLEGAKDTASSLQSRADDAVSSMGGQLKTLAGRLRQNVPQQGMMGSAAESVASTLESGGSYLEEHDLRDMAEEVTTLVRTYPIPAVMVGVGLGFLLGRTLRS